MLSEWSTSGVDLHLAVQPGRGVGSGLAEALRAAVRTGAWPPGLRLPSTRALAVDLGVARGTVTEAYAQLVAEGWLVARRGSGTTVADRVAEPPTATTPEPRTPTPPYDLRPGSPDTSAFPRTAWLAAARRALTRAPAEAFGYGDPRGRPELRAALAAYLARARGVRVTPDRVLVCSGFTQGLGLLCRVLADRGAGALALEAYGLPESARTAAAHGLRTRPLPVDGDGAAVQDLTDEAAVLLTPAHQFPLGAALAPARRAQVVAWAERTGGFVVEDDYDGEFRYDRQPVGALQALAPERVVYAGTASKSLAPGLRLAWLVLPHDLADEVVAAKADADRHSGTLDQLVLAELLASGAYDRHVRRSRAGYRRRRDQLVAAVAGHHVSGIAAGLHLLLDLPGARDEQDVVARAAAAGLALEGLSAYRTGGDPHRPALVVGFGTPPAHAWAGAMERLVAVLTPGVGDRAGQGRMGA